MVGNLAQNPAAAGGRGQPPLVKGFSIGPALGSVA
jgi:hypothetical protein